MYTLISAPSPKAFNELRFVYQAHDDCHDAVIVEQAENLEHLLTLALNQSKYNDNRIYYLTESVQLDSMTTVINSYIYNNDTHAFEALPKKPLVIFGVDPLSDFKEALASMHKTIDETIKNPELQDTLKLLTEKFGEKIQTCEFNDLATITENFEADFKRIFIHEADSLSSEQSVIAFTLPKLLLRGLCAGLFIATGILLGTAVGFIAAGPIGSLVGIVLGVKIAITALALVSCFKLVQAEEAEQIKMLEQQIKRPIEQNKLDSQPRFFKINYEQPMKRIKDCNKNRERVCFAIEEVSESIHSNSSKN